MQNSDTSSSSLPTSFWKKITSTVGAIFKPVEDPNTPKPPTERTPLFTSNKK